MIGLIVITRGEFGEKMLDSALEIIGTQDKVQSFSFFPDQDPETLIKEIIAKIKEWDCPEGVLILSGMCGGTVCNVALSVVKAMEKENTKCELITGLNLYLLISVLGKRVHLPLEELVQQAIDDGRKNILNAKEFFLKKGVPGNE